MSEGPDLEKFHVLEQQVVKVKDFEAEGWILDICAGGEGVIGLLKEQQVISTDIRKDELEEAKNENLKIVMDATELKFLDETFGVVTNFFGFMYVMDDLKEKVFQEVHRVLQPKGRFLVWDVIVPPKTADDQKDFIAFFLKIHLPNKEIGTGYGAGRRPHDQQYYIELAEKNGFKLLNQELQGQTFYLEFEKK
ncbi:MAG: class I SAM-dependent methyltransferase [Candidatus Heimdallarchaeota archaeon]